MKIELVPVIKVDKKIVDSLRVTKKQVNDGLIYSVPDALSVAKENPHKARPFFIELNGEIIGFTMFAFDEEIENENYRYWLWQLMIDEKHQGKGYANSILPLILDYFIEHGVKTITLSTKPSNINAICLYEKFGFKRNGEMNGEEIILQKKLDS